MTKITPTPISRKRLLYWAISGFFALSNAAASQTSNTPSGPKFQKVGERSGVFKVASNLGDCESISHNLSFCSGGTDWVLEREPIRGEQALYQLSKERRASLTVVPMKENASRNLTPAEVVTLLNRQVFADGSRGQMKIAIIAKEELSHSGRILHRRAFVIDNTGHTHLLQVTVLPFDYGLGFLETTIAMPRTAETLRVSEDAVAFHKEFLNRTRVSTSIHR